MDKYTIRFHSAFWQYTNNVKECTIQADSYYNLISNCLNLFPKLRKAINKLARQPGQEVWLAVGGKILSSEKLFMKPSRKEPIVLIPLIFGKGRVLGIIFAIAIIAIAIWAFAPAGAAAAGAVAGAAEAGAGVAGAFSAGIQAGASVFSISSYASMGLSLVMSLATSLLAPKPTKATDAESRAESDMFGDFRNTSSTQNAIGLHYGLIRTPGQFISGFVKTINHDKTEEVKLKDFLTK